MSFTWKMISQFYLSSRLALAAVGRAARAVLFFSNFSSSTSRNKENRFAKMKSRERAFVPRSLELKLVSKFNRFRARSPELLDMSLRRKGRKLSRGTSENFLRCLRAYIPSDIILQLRCSYGTLEAITF